MIIINSLQGRASAPGGQEASSHVHSPPCCLPQQHLERRYRVCTCVFVCVYLCVGVYSVCVCIWGVCMYLCASVYVHVCVSVSVLSLCVCVLLCVYLYVHMWGLGMYLCICPHIQECGCVWLFLCLVCGYVWRTVWLSACVCVSLCTSVTYVYDCESVWLPVCVCVCVYFPHLAPCSRSWACSPRLGFLCDHLQHKQGYCCSICYLARCTAAPMAAELLSVLTFHHPRDSNRSAEKMYLPPYSSEWPTAARKWNTSWVIPAAGNLNISPVVFIGLLGGRLGL